MSVIFRSQNMSYQSMMLPRESAWEILNELGETKCLHFIDHDPNLPIINRPFANYIKRCDEIHIKIDFFKGELKKFNKKIVKCENYSKLLDYYRKLL